VLLFELEWRVSPFDAFVESKVDYLGNSVGGEVLIHTGELFWASYKRLDHFECPGLIELDLVLGATQTITAVVENETQGVTPPFRVPRFKELELTAIPLLFGLRDLRPCVVRNQFRIPLAYTSESIGYCSGWAAHAAAFHPFP
jgi:hypothetical protein